MERLLGEGARQLAVDGISSTGMSGSEPAVPGSYFYVSSDGRRWTGARPLSRVAASDDTIVAIAARTRADEQTRVYIGDNLTTDAHLATICLEHDAALCSADSDFARFASLKRRNPLVQDRGPSRPATVTCPGTGCGLFFIRRHQASLCPPASRISSDQSSRHWK